VRSAEDAGLLEVVVADGRPLLLCTALALLFSGAFAIFLSVRREFLPQIVDCCSRHNHLGFEGHPFVVGIAEAVEKTLDVTRTSPFVTNREGRIHQWIIREGAQETDSVQKVRFADSIRASNARERSETNIDIHQILETRHF